MSEQPFKERGISDPPWPENRYPTPDELVDYYETKTPEEKRQFMARAIANSQSSSECFIQNHHNLWAERESMHRHAAIAHAALGRARNTAALFFEYSTVLNDTIDQWLVSPLTAPRDPIGRIKHD